LLLQRDDFYGDLVKLFEESLHNTQMSNELKEKLTPLLASPGGRKYLESIDDKEFIEMLRKAESLAINELMEK